MAHVYGVSMVGVAPEARTDDEIRSQVSRIVPGAGNHQRTDEQMAGIEDTLVERYHAYTEPLIDP